MAGTTSILARSNQVRKGSATMRTPQGVASARKSRRKGTTNLTSSTTSSTSLRRQRASRAQSGDQRLLESVSKISGRASGLPVETRTTTMVSLRRENKSEMILMTLLMTMTSIMAYQPTEEGRAIRAPTTTFWSERRTFLGHP